MGQVIPLSPETEMFSIRKRYDPPVSNPRVLVLRQSKGMGGMGRAAEFFTPILQAHCRVVGVVCVSAERSGRAQFEAAWSAKARATAVTVWRCIRILFSSSPDAVYLPVSQWGIPLIRDTAIALLARLAGTTPVLHLHGAQLPARLASSRMLRSALTGARWLVLSENVAAELRASGCPVKSVTVVRNPAPPAVGARSPGPPGVLRVGWLGTMCRAKGFDVLCGAVEQMKSRGVGVEFRVAGMRLDVPASDMACVDADFGVLEPVDVTSFWAEVDVFVLPARWVEGLPFVLLEGLQAGCAVAATPSPACTELFEQGCVEHVEATVNSVAAFLGSCWEDLAEIRGRQQRAWKVLRALYEPGHVERSFAQFWRSAGLFDQCNESGVRRAYD